MKKLLFFLLFVIPTFSFAQKEKGFEGEVRTAFELGIDNYKNHSFGAQFVAGYRVNPNLRIGGGTGISWCKHLYVDSHYIGYYYYDEYREAAAYIPIFANAKVNFTKEGISPFFDVDFGYTIYLPFSEYAESNKLGVFIRPSFGIDVPISKGNLNFEIGYKYQIRTCDNWSDPNGNYSQITFGVGYSF